MINTELELVIDVLPETLLVSGQRMIQRLAAERLRHFARSDDCTIEGVEHFWSEDQLKLRSIATLRKRPSLVRNALVD